EELVGWTLDRTASIPKNQRFTFGQRLDNNTLDALLLVVRAIFTKGDMRRRHLADLNLRLEELRVLWRIVEKRGWIGQRQLLFVNEKIDEIGRMAGGWIRKETPAP
ncbi:MAG: four helix bundle protein, partial [Kiritimatiellia bacterium]